MARKLLAAAFAASVVMFFVALTGAGPVQAFAQSSNECSSGSAVVCQSTEITFWTCEQWEWTGSGTSVTFTCARWKQVTSTKYWYWKYAEDDPSGSLGDIMY